MSACGLGDHSGVSRQLDGAADRHHDGGRDDPGEGAAGQVGGARRPQAERGDDHMVTTPAATAASASPQARSGCTAGPAAPAGAASRVRLTPSASCPSPARFPAIRALHRAFIHRKHGGAAPLAGGVEQEHTIEQRGKKRDQSEEVRSHRRPMPSEEHARDVPAALGQQRADHRAGRRTADRPAVGSSVRPAGG